MNYSSFIKIFTVLVLSYQASFAGYPLFPKLHDIDKELERFQTVASRCFIVQALPEVEKSTLQEEDKLINLYAETCEAYMNGYLFENDSTVNPAEEEEYGQPERDKYHQLWVTLPLKEYGEDAIRRDFILFLHLSVEQMLIGFKTPQMTNNQLSEEEKQSYYKLIFNGLLQARSEVFNFFFPTFNKESFLEENKIPEEEIDIVPYATHLLTIIPQERRRIVSIDTFRLKSFLLQSLESRTFSDTQVVFLAI